MKLTMGALGILLSVLFTDVVAKNKFEEYLIIESQEVQVDFWVNGKAVCESTIEQVVSEIKGVKSVDWNAASGNMTVVYYKTALQPQTIYFKLAEAGYDNQYLRAHNDKYDGLSVECKYDRQ